MPLTFNDALQRAATIPRRFTLFTRALSYFSRLAGWVVRVGGVVLLFFILHQLFFWLAKDPQKAFTRATLVLDVLEISWDVTGIIYNPAVEVANSLIIPVWNAYTYYVVEPAVFLVLEVFSMVFLRHKYNGVIKESSFPYGGFVCDTSEASTSFCGRFSAYNARLIGGASLTNEQSAQFGSSATAGRMLSEEAINITFSIAFARRLSETAGAVTVDVPATDTTELTDALAGVATQAILLAASLADLLFSVLYNVLETSAVFIFDAIFIVLKTLMEVLKFFIKSGVLQYIIGIGVDFILIVGLEVYLPLVFTMLDMLICAFQLFMWNTWEEQLRCGAPTVREPARLPPGHQHPFDPLPHRRPQPSSSASRAPTPRPTGGSSAASPTSSTATHASWKPRSTRVRGGRCSVAALGAAKSTSASRASRTPSLRSPPPAAPRASSASSRSCDSSGSSRP